MRKSAMSERRHKRTNEIKSDDVRQLSGWNSEIREVVNVRLPVRKIFHVIKYTSHKLHRHFQPQ